MANIKSYNNDYVRFYIDSALFGKQLMHIEPGGWDDDNLELDRAKNHGIFNKFSNTLEFYKKYKDTIEDTFKTLGNNSSLYLIKEELLDDGDNVKFIEVYRGKADWETKKIVDNVLKIKFNSNQIEDLIKANEDDEFELDRLNTIDDKPMDELKIQKVEIKGRTLTSNSVSALAKKDIYQDNELFRINNNYTSGYIAKTRIISRGFDRHSSVETVGYNLDDGDNDGLPNNMFIVESTQQEDNQELNLKFDIDIDYKINGYSTPEQNRQDLYFQIILSKIQRNQISANVFEYEEIENYILFEDNSQDLKNNWEQTTDFRTLKDTFLKTVNLEWNQGLVLRYYTNVLPGPMNRSSIYAMINFRKQNILFDTTSFVEASPSLNCIFLHDAYSRLINIITNDKTLFYSKYFGNIELGYNKDGKGGLIGLINGYWIRDFDKETPKYKAPQLSFKNLLKSTNATFNVGMGTESINNKTRVRVEEVKYFYQNLVMIHLGKATNVEREYDKDLYFSSLEFGQTRGGDYDNDTGLDEPNFNANYITPDRKSINKYRKISRIRSDGTEMEILRRKPQIDYPEKDYGSDSHNWYLDLKRKGGNFTQKDWFDRLSELPEGINSPETYRNFHFTPLRMMFRHGWIISSGLQPYKNRNIQFSNSKLNANLKTKLINDNQAFQENLPNGLEVGVLNRPRMLPETVKFEIKLSKEILNKIYSKSRVYYNGEYENIPNYYFRFSWINENNKYETGYLMNMRPENLGKFTMQKANN